MNVTPQTQNRHFAYNETPSHNIDHTNATVFHTKPFCRINCIYCKTLYIERARW